MSNLLLGRIMSSVIQNVKLLIAFETRLMLGLLPTSSTQILSAPGLIPPTRYYAIITNVPKNAVNKFASCLSAEKCSDCQFPTLQSSEIVEYHSNRRTFLFSSNFHFHLSNKIAHNTVTWSRTKNTNWNTIGRRINQLEICRLYIYTCLFSHRSPARLGLPSWGWGACGQ